MCVFFNTILNNKCLAQQNAGRLIAKFGYKYAKYTKKNLAPFYSKKKKSHINAKMFKLLN